MTTSVLHTLKKRPGEVNRNQVVKLLTNNSAEREFSEENHLGIAQLPANHFMRLTSNLSEAFGNRRLGFTQELGIGSFAVFAEGEIGGDSMHAEPHTRT